MNDNFIENYKNALLSIPSARLGSGNREIIMRCRYCPDSKDPKSAHMYVSIPKNDTPGLFNCYKCHTSGIVTREKLLEWGLFEHTDLIVDLSKYNNKIMKMPKNNRFNDKVYYLSNKFIREDKLSEAKLKYINNRLGLQLNYNDLIENKIVLNLHDLLSFNHIDSLTRDSRIVDQLDKAFLGFISLDNAFINMRRLVSEDKVNEYIRKRYINYNIFDKFDNTLRYYVLPTKIDLTSRKRIRLNIAEGPFDILSILYNLRNGDKNNCIYASILGSSYLNIIKYFIINVGIVNMEVHIYIDSDINRIVLKQIKELLYPFMIPIYVHENKNPNCKDFGVRKEEIDEYIYQLL